MQDYLESLLNEISEVAGHVHIERGRNVDTLIQDIKGELVERASALQSTEGSVASSDQQASGTALRGSSADRESTEILSTDSDSTDTNRGE